MIIRRRSLLLALTALVTCPSIVLAAQRPSRKEIKGFDWTNSGVRPYTGSMEQALTLLASGGLVPPPVLVAFREKIRNNASYQDTIPDGYFFTRMLFGNGVRVSNVVAHTAQWSQEASRTATVYEHWTVGKVYVLLRPQVCGNWALRIVGIQGVCIACIECTEDAEEGEKIRREQVTLEHHRKTRKKN